MRVVGCSVGRAQASCPAPTRHPSAFAYHERRHSDQPSLVVDVCGTLGRVATPGASAVVLLTWPDGMAVEFPWGPQVGFGSAAYWTARARDVGVIPDHRLGNNLRQEVAACILGGYGIRAEVALAAFKRLQAAGVLDGGPLSSDTVATLLLEPLPVAGRMVRYRFSRQRATWLARALSCLDESHLPGEPSALRETLMTLPGVGPKIASQVVRNHLELAPIGDRRVHGRRIGRPSQR